MVRLPSSIVVALAFAGAVPASGQEAELPPPLAAEPWEMDLAEERPQVPTVASFEEQVLELVNARRLDCDNPAYACSVACPAEGLAPFRGHWRLHRAAAGHSGSMALSDFFAHNDFPSGCATPGQRVAAAGYVVSGSLSENIAAGYSTPTLVVDGWMASAGHCAFILGSRREIGVGWFQQAGDLGNVQISRDSDCLCSDESPPPADPCAAGPYEHYWTLDFASRASTDTTAFPLVLEREAYETGSTTADVYLYDAGGSSKQMRFSDDGETWSGLVAYSAASVWTLAPGDGVKVVYGEFQSSAGTFRSCDRIRLATGGAAADVVFRDSFECGDPALGLWDQVVP